MGTPSPGTIRKTRYMLSAALMRLLERRSFQKISVGDLCQEAMVSRSAFYTHFADKYELLRFTLEGMLRFKDEIDREMPLEKRMILLLEKVQENRRMIEHLVLADLSRELLEIVTDTLQKVLADWIRQNMPDIAAAEPVDLVAAFYAGGIGGTIMNWVRENYATPKEEVAGCPSRLLMKMMQDAGPQEQIRGA